MKTLVRIPVTPSGETNVDTMYYIQSAKENYTDSGLFFLGKKALLQYVGWIRLHRSSLEDPTAAGTAANVAALNEISRLESSKGNTQADLQAYYRGYCFYRGWIRDAEATVAANKILVRRNHVYMVSCTGLKAPGIASPNDIIDPQPRLMVEADTYCTATVNVVPWHIVNMKSIYDGW